MRLTKIQQKFFEKNGYLIVKIFLLKVIAEKYLLLLKKIKID